MDVDEFLALPLVARVAANGPNGPTVRPVWFLYESGTFWWLTGSSYSRLGEWLAVDPRVAITIDTCDVTTGSVLALGATGEAVVSPLDPGLATRKLTKYLGNDKSQWPDRFKEAFDDPTTRLVSLCPVRQLKLRDMSFAPPPARI